MPRLRCRSTAASDAERGPMRSSLKSESPAMVRKQKAAARSAELTALFMRLASNDAKLRQCVDSTEFFPEGQSESDGNRGLEGAQPSNPSAPSPHPIRPPALKAPPTGVILSNGRAVVLSANSRGMPPIFREQLRLVQAVEMTTSDMQRTLHQLQRDLTFHARGREDGARDAAGPSAPLHPHPPGNGDMPVPISGDATAAQLRGMAEADAHTEAIQIQRARAAAADEGAADDQSVEDYGVDCEVPPLNSESRLADEIAILAVSVGKMKESTRAMAETEAAAPNSSSGPWWTSALKMRDMKAGAARLDYHAHTALNWSYRAREQLLLQAAMLNTISAETRTQLIQQQNHSQEFHTRLRDMQQTYTQLQADITQYHVRIQAEMTRRAELQDELRVSAKQRGLVDPGESNSLKAELALLLKEHVWPTAALQRDADVVLTWLHSTSTALD